MRYFALAAALLVTACVQNTTSKVVAQPVPPSSDSVTHELVLTVKDVRSAKGQLRAELLGRSEGEEKPKTVTYAVQDAVAGTNVIRFSGLAAGDYAVQLYHDENGNSKVDLNIVGVPTEGYGFSNVLIVRGGIPPFDTMKVVVPADSAAVAVLAYAP
jgi:uncharacterized protein (DUF2141 family)